MFGIRGLDLFQEARKTLVQIKEKYVGLKNKRDYAQNEFKKEETKLVELKADMQTALNDYTSAVDDAQRNSLWKKYEEIKKQEKNQDNAAKELKKEFEEAEKKLRESEKERNDAEAMLAKVKKAESIAISEVTLIVRDELTQLISKRIRTVAEYENSIRFIGDAIHQ